MLQGKIVVFYVYVTIGFLRIDLFTSSKTCDSLFRNNENESSLDYTEILYRF